MNLLKLFLSISLALVGITAYATCEQPDTIGLSKEPIPSFMIPAESPTSPSELSPETTANHAESSVAFQKAMTLMRYEQYRINSIDIQQSFPSPYVASWSAGGIYGERNMIDFPGMMGVDNATINLTHNFGPVNVTAWADATKYGYFRGMQTGYGFGASLTYTISDKWSVTAFGQYYTPLHPLTPAMAGMMNSTRIGGYASYNFNEHWGISVGAQATRSLVTNRWEAQPIVTPYYRINKDVSIGIDVGGILYNIARDYIDSHNRNALPPAANGPRPVPIPRPNTRR